MTIQRGLLLFQQSRFEMAETELRQGLTAEPGDAFGHALLALCLVQRERLPDATTEAQQAVHLAPDLPFAHYALAKVWAERNHHDKAQTAIAEAIRLDPEDPDFRALLSAIHFDQQQWKQALQAADEGLALDAEHTESNNLRAMALVKLGRKSEAGATIDAALARDPENPATHANQGWTLLERRKPAEAVEHFREALRLDPSNEWARQGMIEALKAHNALYAVMLRYFLWMLKLSPRAQWGVIIGGVVANRLVTNMARANPELAPWLMPLRILYVVFVLLTWTADPFFNLVLRLNRFGRLALSREQVVESNWMGATLVLALLSLGACVVAGFDSPFLMAAMVFGFLVLPLAGSFKSPEGWPRTAMWTYTGVFALVGLAGVGWAFASAPGDRDVAWALFGVYALGVVGSGWIANAFMFRGRPKR